MTPIARRATWGLAALCLQLGCNAIIGLDAPTKANGSGGQSSSSTGGGGGATTSTTSSGTGGSTSSSSTTSSSTSSSSTSSSSTSSSSTTSSSSSSGSANGDACASGQECASTYCVRGFCCDKACDQACQACRASEKSSNQDDGICGEATAGTLCGTSCSVNMVVLGSCQTGGTCKVNSGMGMSTCDDNLLCKPAFGCPSACWADADCVSGTFCAPTTDPSKRSCVMPQGPGGECDAANQCLSNACASGKCG